MKIFGRTKEPRELSGQEKLEQSLSEEGIYGVFDGAEPLVKSDIRVRGFVDSADGITISHNSEITSPRALESLFRLAGKSALTQN